MCRVQAVPTAEEVLTSLKIGAPRPDVFDAGVYSQMSDMEQLSAQFAHSAYLKPEERQDGWKPCSRSTKILNESVKWYYANLRRKERDSLELGFNRLKEFRGMHKRFLTFWQLFRMAVVVQRAGATGDSAIILAPTD